MHTQTQTLFLTSSLLNTHTHTYVCVYVHTNTEKEKSFTTYKLFRIIFKDVHLCVWETTFQHRIHNLLTNSKLWSKHQLSLMLTNWFVIMTLIIISQVGYLSKLWLNKYHFQHKKSFEMIQNFTILWICCDLSLLFGCVP